METEISFIILFERLETEVLKYIILYVLLHICWCMPIKSNRILFMSYAGKYYNDNPKAISDYLLEHFRNYELVWLVTEKVNDKDNFGKNIKFVNKKSLLSIYMLATSRIWIDNCRKASWIRKRRGQYYIQTWHGGIALKMVEKDTETLLSKNHVKCAKNDSLMADLMISNSKWQTQVIKRAFWYNGQILECGTPRLDKYLDITDENIKFIRKKIALFENIRYVLYAPTFRNSEDLKIYDLNYERLCGALEKKFGGHWCVLMRLHPNISGLQMRIPESEKCINVTRYPELYDLLAVSEILITDYSSSMFEAGLMNKKVFLYCNDIEDYQKERPLYFDIRSLPYMLAETMEELEDKIEAFDFESYKKKVAEFDLKLGIRETGTACERISNIIKRMVEI